MSKHDRQQKHTPGPWFAHGSFVIASDPRSEDFHRHVAYTLASAGLRAMEANARLIAAGPDLLAALAWVVRATEHEGCPYCDNAETGIGHGPECILALAVTKAEGGAP